MTRQQAINAKCKDCIYDECAPGNWRQQVTACTIRSCSLWEYRPKSRPKVRSTAILAHPQTDSPKPLGVVAGTPLVAAADTGRRGQAHPQGELGEAP
jgi:hypothetical protein